MPKIKEKYALNYHTGLEIRVIETVIEILGGQKLLVTAYSTIALQSLTAPLL